MTERSYATVNPCVMCQPMGSVLAFKGIEDTMVLLHGSQGCSTYMRLYLAHHFREPVDIASSALSERGAVYGGSENLKKGLKNVILQYQPRLIGVATTCMAETIGEDINSIIREFKEEEGIDDIIIIPVSTPSYENSHINGYLKAINATIRHLTKNKNNKNGKVNIILGENISPADIRELKQIASDTVGPYILIPDISDTFDAPPNTPKIPRGGTPLSEIADMGNSTATISLGTASTNPAAEYLQETHNIPNYNVPLPIGLKNTDQFFDTLHQISGHRTPESYQKERGRLLDAMVDVHKYTYGIKTAIYGDPEAVLGILSLTLELGMHPVLVATGSQTPRFSQIARNHIEDTHPDCNVLEGIDFDTFNDAVKKTGPQILIGNSNVKYISREEKIPLVRVGLPIHDRVGAQRILTLGYKGAMELIDRITNTILETHETENTNPPKITT